MLKNSRLTSDLFHLGVRQFGIKCLALLAVTYALRQLGPTGVGQAGVAFGLVSVLGIITQLGIDALLPKDLAGQQNLAGRIRIAGELYSLRITLQVFSWPLFAAGALWQMRSDGIILENITTLLIWLAAYAYLVGNGCSPQLWMQGIDSLPKLGDRQLLVSIVTAAMMLFCFFWWPVVPAFVFIQAFGLLLLSHLVFKDYGLERNIIARVTVLKKLGAHVVAAWPLIFNALVAYVYGSLDVLIVASLPSHEQIGQYTAAITFSNGANAFLGLVPLALYPRLLDWVRRSPKMACKRVIILAIVMLVLSVPLFYLLQMICRLIVPFFLGREYDQTASILTAILIQYLLYIGVFAVGSLFIALGKTKRALVISLVGAVGAVPTYILAAHRGGAVLLSYGKLYVYAGMLLLALGLLLQLMVNGERDLSAVEPAKNSETAINQ